MNSSASISLEAVIIPRTSKIGIIPVRRALPSAKRRMVGPFVFLDQMGPERLVHKGVDVPPHPHIGLATITYLFEGALTHRDSLGTVQIIRPGDVNWMMAGNGIVHSERTPPELRRIEHTLFGIQAWVALSREDEEVAPWFEHQPEQALPVIEGEGISVRLIAGALFGVRSPVRTCHEMFYADAQLASVAHLELQPEYAERAAYLVAGVVEVDNKRYHPGTLLVLREGAPVSITAGNAGARLMLLGGDALEGPRHIWWNFVSSSRARIEKAKADWKNGNFVPVPEETGAIPLPEGKPRPVKYP